MKFHLVLRIIVKMVLPFILMFGFYVQLHGEYSPGGGFQAGVILASAFILYALIFGPDQALAVFPPQRLQHDRGDHHPRQQRRLASRRFHRGSDHPPRSPLRR